MNTIAVDSNWQLFLDDHVIMRATGLDRRIHHPRFEGVVIDADKPWETFGTALHYVQRCPDGSFQAFYNAMWWDPAVGQCDYEGFRVDRTSHQVGAVALAVSDDGKHWDKPDLGLRNAPAGIDWKDAPLPAPKGSTKANNLGVPFAFVQDLATYGNVTDPSRRYAIRLASTDENATVGASWRYRPEGYFAAEVPDFINDPHWEEKLMPSGGNFAPRRHIVQFWDGLHEEWVAIEQGVIGHWFPSREIARYASKDLIHWTGQSVLYPDPHDKHHPDYYDEPMHLTPYCNEGVVLGQLTWFHSDRTYPEGGPVFRDTTKTHGHPDHFPGSRKGTCEIRITLSRDGGKTWDRTCSREAWIAHGPEENSVNRCVCSLAPPLYVGDEDWFYVDLVDGDHLPIRLNAEQSPYNREYMRRHRTGLYTQKHHRYVSLSAKAQREVLITKSVKLCGDTLQLNVDASRGSIRVAIASARPLAIYDNVPVDAPHLIQTKHGQFLDGFSFEDCIPVHDNSIEHTVEFKEKSVSSLKGKDIYLFFEIINADLYGFRSS